MADTLDRAQILINKARAEMQKSGNRVPRENVALRVVEFLNSDKTVDETIMDLFPNGYKNTAVVQRFKSVIKEDGYSELVWPTKTENGAALVKLV